jgi:hypothetical protein
LEGTLTEVFNEEGKVVVRTWILLWTRTVGPRSNDDCYFSSQEPSDSLAGIAEKKQKVQELASLS